MSTVYTAENPAWSSRRGFVHGGVQLYIVLCTHYASDTTVIQLFVGEVIYI
jgi:hypothetical protein